LKINSIAVYPLPQGLVYVNDLFDRIERAYEAALKYLETTVEQAVSTFAHYVSRLSVFIWRILVNSGRLARSILELLALAASPALFASFGHELLLFESIPVRSLGVIVLLSGLVVLGIVGWTFLLVLTGRRRTPDSEERDGEAVEVRRQGQRAKAAVIGSDVLAMVIIAAITRLFHDYAFRSPLLAAIQSIVRSLITLAYSFSIYDVMPW
jgi:hypothetical protein